MSTPASPTTVTLRALAGEPLRDDVVRRMVVATAHAIAERSGVEVRRVDAAPDRVTITLDAGRLGAIGFAAELRRLTSQWYAHKFGGAPLWGEPPAVAGEEEIRWDDPETWR